MVEGPYREAKPLNAIIAPDRRRQRAAVLVLASMVTGAVIFQGARMLLESSSTTTTSPNDPPPLPSRPTSTNRIPSATLSGPDGRVTFPTSSRVIVNVWLQGCQDCMPAFEAMRAINAHGGLGVRARVINVAYGEADPAWAAQYGVRDNLVYDTNGASIVKPLGISTFTTLVVDRDGVIIHRDRPDQAGYAERLRGLVEGVDRPDTIQPAAATGELSSEEVQRVVAQHRVAIRDACWDRNTANGPTSAKVTASIVVSAKGDVVDASAKGTDAAIALCVENQVRTWKFPAHGERSVPINIPFVFARE